MDRGARARTPRRIAPVAALLACVLAACAGEAPARQAPARLGSGPPGAIGRVRVDPVIVVSTVLFPEEEREIRAGLAAFLAHASGGRLAPIDGRELERVAALALSGRRLSTGQACGAPVPPGSAFEAAFGKTLVAESRVGCDDRDGCALTIEVVGRSIADERTTLERWRAPLPPRPGLHDVRRAVAALAPAPPPDGAYGGILGVLARQVPGVSVTDAMYAGSWPAAPPLSVYASVKPALDACATDVRRDDWKNEIIVEVSPAGTVTRCEPWLWHRLPEPGSGCVCRALSRVSFGAGPEGRRARLETSSSVPHPQLEGGRVVHAYVADEGSPDESVLAARTGVSPNALSRCFADAPPTSEVTAAVRWEVDASGRALGVTVDMPQGGVRACVEGVLRGASFACPQRGAPTTVTATLRAFAFQPVELGDVLRGK